MDGLRNVHSQTIYHEFLPIVTAIRASVCIALRL